MASPQNGWLRAYAEAPEILDGFARAEDPDGLLASILQPTATWSQLRVLELGCGSGRLASALRQQLHPALWLGVDTAKALLHLARQKDAAMLLLRARVEALPFANQSWDVVVASWVLAYLPPPSLRRCLSEVRRVLRGGGCFWVIENAAPPPQGGMPEDGNTKAFSSLGLQLEQVVATELRFSSQQEAREITQFLMGAAAPQADSRGCIPHRIAVYRLQV